jgi:trans-aconitate methyltransferase
VVAVPTSAVEGKPWLVNKILVKEPTSVLDIGAGSGTYGKLLRPHLPKAFMTAVEIHAAYVSDYKLWRLYDSVVIGDARTADLPQADVVILGDVLEHMSQPDALALWDRCRDLATKAVYLSIPIVEWPQEAMFGNEYERHVHTWSHNSALQLPGVTDWWQGSNIGCYEALSTTE